MTYSLDFRKCVISFIKDGGSQKDAMRIFNVSHNTIYRWLNSSDLAPKKHGFRRRKLDKEALRKHVNDFPDQTLRERSEHFNVHLSAIGYALKVMKMVKKNSNVMPKDVI